MPIIKGIIGKKIGMTQIFADGKVIPVTVVEASPNSVIQVKTAENDGYDAFQLGYGAMSPKHVTQPLKGHFKKSDTPHKRYLKEFKFAAGTYQPGDIVRAETFAAGDVVDVSGTSKGKGYAGTIKRYNGHRLKQSHGVGPVSRHAGSMGAHSDPSRIFKGKKMPGHMGAEKVTVQNLTIVKVDTDNNLIAIKGAVPGPKGGIVAIQNAVKA